MVALMVLDHVREYFSFDALQFDPMNVWRTTPALFVARWVTHLCAPTFVFLAGASAYLQRQNGRVGWSLSKRLLTRGTWLIAFELTVVGFAFNFSEPFLFLQVIWAIGLGFVVLSLLTAVPLSILAALGAALIVFNGWLAACLAPPLLPAPIWHALVLPGPLDPAPGMVAYPALPWVGILMLGYAAGPTISSAVRQVRWNVVVGGALMLLAFAMLRIADVGDAEHWGQGPTPALRGLSFLAVNKYPPSPQYVLLTLGISALLLAVLTTVPCRRATMIHAFGRAPFFTYILHIYIIHASALLVGVALGISPTAFLGFIQGATMLKDAQWGFGLPSVIAIWIAALLVLRPAAIWFARLKSERSWWWLSYL